MKTAETIASPLSTTTSRSQWLLLVLATGIVARAFWLCLGASSLARLRRSAVPVDPHSRRAVERRRPRRRLRFSSGRHDWLNVVAEEIVRTIFWFHPVLWWLIDRIQLSREHVVDEAVVALTKSRER